MKKHFFLVIAVATILSACGIKHESADLIIHNARIYTLNSTNDIVQAVAIRDGKIIEVGAERQILNKYRSEHIIDAAFKAVYPGFIDAHCHFLGYGLTLQDVNLVGTKSFKEVIDRVVNQASPDSKAWIVGRGWDQNDWDTQVFPNRQMLDSLFPDRPVVLKRIDGHAILVNQVVLELAGLSVATEIEGGELMVKSGQLTGVLIDNAMSFVFDRMPENDTKTLEKALISAQANCFGVGLTTVDDAGLDIDEVDLIRIMQDDGRLKMRIYAMMSDDPLNFEALFETGPIKTDRLNVRSFKFYADGSLGSRGACLVKPYSDAEDSLHTGFLLDSISYYQFRAQQLFDAGFQMNTHCIGDSANRTMLEVYGNVLEGHNDKRWRIEHAQVLHSKDRRRFADFSIVPSVQPTHATSDMYWAGERLGRNRVRRAYAYNDLKEQIGIIALGTDFPVEGISPLRTFYAAVARKDVEGFPKEGFQMENALSREDALLGMTLWAAMANFEEGEKGTVEPGKLADLVMLDRDIMQIPEVDILEVQVEYTIVNGEVVYSKK
ncbi:MAG: putative amidohydrolase YtcJ [Flavobacteriales bacterium]|jgi:predicted amidohydrolase YtcJ